MYSKFDVQNPLNLYSLLWFAVQGRIRVFQANNYHFVSSSCSKNGLQRALKNIINHHHFPYKEEWF